MPFFHSLPQQEARGHRSDRVQAEGLVAVLTGAVEVLGDGVKKSILGGQEPLHYRHGYFPVLKSLHPKKKTRTRKRVRERE